MKHEPLYPTYGKPHPNAGIHMLRGYPRWHWWDSDQQENRYKYVHIWVWEQCRGPVSKGYIVHHINGDPADYRIENLALKTKKEHQQHHLGMPVVGGMKVCSKCKKVLPVSEFASKGRKLGKRAECKACRQVIMSKWSADHPGYYKEKASTWAREHKERRNQVRRAHRKTNREEINRKQREWREANLEDQQRKRKEREAMKKISNEQEGQERKGEKS